MTELLSSLAAGVALGLSAGLSPGPLTALLLGESLRHGRTAGLRIAFVPLVSDPPVVALSVWMLAALSSHDPVVGAISLLGSLFVAYLAWESLSARAPGPDSRPTPRSSLAKGVLTNWLNPHPYLFWISVGAPLMLRAGSATAAVVFVASFYACLVGAKVAMALVVHRFRDLLVSRFYLLVNRLLGAILALFSLLLARDGVRLLGLLG